MVVLCGAFIESRAFAGAAGAAPVSSPRAELAAAIEQLQKTPDDAALREKIIRLARLVKPAPAVPEDARRHFVKAVTMQKAAKNPGDYDLPADEYRKALLLAPWWTDAYFNLAKVHELKKEFPEAIRNLKLSIAAGPEGPEARAAQDKIYELEADIDMQSKAEEGKRREKSSKVIVPGRSVGPAKMGMTLEELRSSLGDFKDTVRANDGTWVSYTWDGLQVFADLPSGQASSLEATSASYALEDGLAVGAAESEILSKRPNPFWTKDKVPPDMREYCFSDGLLVTARGGLVVAIKVWSPGCNGASGHYQCYQMGSNGHYRIGARCQHD